MKPLTHAIRSLTSQDELAAIRREILEHAPEALEAWPEDVQVTFEDGEWWVTILTTGAVYTAVQVGLSSYGEPEFEYEEVTPGWDES